MEVKVKFNDINVKEEKEKTLVKILMLKGEKGDTASAEWGTITGSINDQTDLKNALDSKANQAETTQALNQKANTSDLNNYYTKTQSDTLLGSKLGTEDIVDTLDSTDYSKVLSANQGRVLKEELDKKITCFDNVALMKSSTELKAGMYVKTEGYYSINDSGGSEYYITSSQSSRKIQESLSNNLYAELIIKNSEINVKQLGAYGDGTHDDTLKIQQAIDYLKNEIINNNSFYNNTSVVFPGGIYKVTDTINTYPFIRIKTLSNTTITSSIDKSIFKVIALDGLPSDIYASYTLCDVFDGRNGLKIENTNSEATNSIGIEVINNLSSTNRKTSKITFDSVALIGNKIGIKLNNANMYLIRFVNVNFANNEVGIQFGDSTNYSQTNSGENFVFDRCMFVNDYAVRFYVSGIDCNFINCSFDFCKNVFDQAKSGGYRKIYISGGHIEGITESILTNNMTSSEIYIEGVRFCINSNLNYFPSSMHGTYVFIKSSTISFNESSNQSPTSFLFPEANVIIKDCIVGLDKSGKPLGFSKNIVLHNTFDNVEAGEITYSAGGAIGSYKMDGRSNISTIECIDTNIFDGVHAGKLIRVTKNDTSANCYLALMSDFIPVNVQNMYRLYVSGKNCFKNSSCVVKCYDINKTALQNLTIYYNNTQESNNNDNHLFTKHYAQFVIPENTVFMKVEYIFANENSQVSSFDIAGIFVEKV